MPSRHRAKHRHFRPLNALEIKAVKSEFRNAVRTGFLLDANMETWAAYVMRYKKFDVWECDRARVRYSDDQAVFAAAWKLGRLLVTHDQDFLDDRHFPFARCAGLLVVPTYGSVSMVFANLLACACELVSKGGPLWFHTKIVAQRDFTVKVRSWDKSEGRITGWSYRIALGYRKAAASSCA
jgi:hypothetical protein